jgi:hypothetical protein
MMNGIGDLGRLANESSFLALSAAFLRRCRMVASRGSSTRFCFSNSCDQPVHEHLIEVVATEERSPDVASTRKSPSFCSRIEMSKVPPPRS